MKKQITVFVILLATLIVIITGVRIFANDTNEKTNKIIMTPEELNQCINDGKDKLVIDLRDEKDYKESHIEGAINMPFTDEGVKLLNHLKKKNAKNVPIYLICYSGNRSAKAFNLLVENNYTNLNYVKFGFEEFALKMSGSVFFETGECPCKSE